MIFLAGGYSLDIDVFCPLPLSCIPICPFPFPLPKLSTIWRFPPILREFRAGEGNLEVIFFFFILRVF